MHPTTSPSKTSYNRTYDSKLVTREMHRLGTVPPGSASLPNPASIAQTSTATSSNDPWGVLHVNLLPLFNGEPLKVPIEELNLLVKRHIAFAASSPSKALSTLENDTMELLSSGMVTLNAKLVGIEDDKLLSRVVELWGFFWDQVLTYVEGVLLPLQTDSLLSSLYRKRPSSPTRQTSKPSISSSLALTGHGKSTNFIDVRTVALRSFRDKIILPLSNRLYARITSINSGRNQDGVQEIPPRMQQMLLVLASQSRPRPPTLSLSSPPPQPSTGEAAISDLLRALHTNTRSQAGRPGHNNPGRGHLKSNQSRPSFELAAGGASGPTSVRAPSFLSGGAPRDRRGRIAQKARGKGLAIVPGDSQDDISGDETPRNGYMDGHAARLADLERQREREFLESLRSPDLEPPASNSGTPTGSSTTATARASVGGWGLGAGNVDLDTTKQPGEDDEDEPLDWDQAQAVVERMVGMNSTQPAPTQSQSQSQENVQTVTTPTPVPPSISRRRMT